MRSSLLVQRKYVMLNGMMERWENRTSATVFCMCHHILRPCIRKQLSVTTSGSQPLSHRPLWLQLPFSHSHTQFSPRLDTRFIFIANKHCLYFKAFHTFTFRYLNVLHFSKIFNIIIIYKQQFLCKNVVTCNCYLVSINQCI